MSDIIAYHEAGHALVAVLLGGEVRQVTIEPDHDDGPRREGDTQVVWRCASDREFAACAVRVSLAGPVAEMIYTGDPYHPGQVAEWAADWRQAWRAAAAFHRDERKRLAHLERQTAELHRQLQADQVWAALAALADHLLAHETLEADEVRQIVADWL